MAQPQASNQPRRTLLLTGASRGIGHATVKRFSAAGWRVITCSRHAFPENCPWEMGPEDHIQVDLSDPADTLRAVGGDPAERLTSGELHALVNNAGISPKATGGGRLGTLNTPEEDWRRVFQVNFFAPILLARGLLEELKRTHGAVVNVTSIAGSRVHPFAGRGLCHLEGGAGRADPRDGGGFRPARRPGERHRAGRDRHLDPLPGTEKIVEQIPMQRLGTPDEVAKIIYVLCTETSSYLNGAEIHINGGQHV